MGSWLDFLPTELSLFGLALTGLGFLAYKRRRSPAGVTFFAAAGFLPLVLFTALDMGGAWPFLARWLFLGGVFFYVLRGSRVPNSWQCPECLLYNEGATLRCLCGYDVVDEVSHEPWSEESVSWLHSKAPPWWMRDGVPPPPENQDS